ncbi:MAG: protein kinase, partial [Planctomycetota bacterium]
MSLNVDVIQLYEQWLDINEVDRARWLDQRSDVDDSMRAELFRLIALRTNAEQLFGEDSQESGSNPSPPLSPGDSIDDFLIEGLIGVGGMGVVYRAIQKSLNRVVALKVLPEFLAHSESARKRFLIEVESAAKLKHPNIVSVYTSGAKGRLIYYAMEFIDGVTLLEVIRRGSIQFPSPVIQDQT